MKWNQKWNQERLINNTWKKKKYCISKSRLRTESKVLLLTEGRGYKACWDVWRLLRSYGASNIVTVIQHTSHRAVIDDTQDNLHTMSLNQTVRRLFSGRKFVCCLVSLTDTLQGPAACWVSWAARGWWGAARCLPPSWRVRQTSHSSAPSTPAWSSSTRTGLWSASTPCGILGANSSPQGNENLVGMWNFPQFDWL